MLIKKNFDNFDNINRNFFSDSKKSNIIGWVKVCIFKS